MLNMTVGNRYVWMLFFVVVVWMVTTESAPRTRSQGHADEVVTIRCNGAGAPTVVIEDGNNSPGVGGKQRALAWDR